jgi:hypothetical protein
MDALILLSGQASRFAADPSRANARALIEPLGRASADALESVVDAIEREMAVEMTVDAPASKGIVQPSTSQLELLIAGSMFSTSPLSDQIMQYSSKHGATLVEHPEVYAYLYPYLRLRFPAWPPDHILRQSLLVAAITHLEAAFTASVHIYLAANPRATSDDSRTLTLAELLRMSSIEEATDLLFHRRARDLARGGPQEWTDGLRSIGLRHEISNRSPSWSEVVEMHARRHAIVHNHGAADSQYVRSLAKDQSGVVLGRQLVVDDTYLTRALDLLSAFGTCLVLRFMSWLQPRGTTARGLVDELTVGFITRAMLERRWVIASELAEGSKPIVRDPAQADTRLVFSWVAKRALGRASAVSEQVNRWTPLSSSPLWDLARAILTDNDERAEELASSLVAAGDLGAGDLRGLPVYGDATGMRLPWVERVLRGE